MKLLIAGLVIAAVTAWLVIPPNRISRDNFEKIQVGMSEEAVEEILGGPAGIYTSVKTTYGHIPGTAHRIEEVLRKEGLMVCVEWCEHSVDDCVWMDKTLPVPGRKIWYGPVGYVSIHFTPAGNVEKKYFNEANGFGFWDRLRTWIPF